MYAHPPIGRSVNRSEINAQARLCYPRHRQCQWAACLGATRRLERDCRDPVRDHCADGAPRSPRAGARRGRCAAPCRRARANPGRGSHCAALLGRSALPPRVDQRGRHRGAAPAAPARALRPHRGRHGRRAGRPDSGNGRRRPSVRESDSRRRIQPEEHRRGPRILHLASDRSSELHGRQDGDAVLQAG